MNLQKQKHTELDNGNQNFVLYCFGLHTQNPGLREVDLEPSPKRGSDKIDMLK